MNLNLLKCLQEQKQYDEILQKSNESNLCPSNYKTITSVFYSLSKNSCSENNEREKKQQNSLRILTFNIAEFVEQLKGLEQIEKVINSNEINGKVDIICLTEILSETWNQFISERKLSKQKVPNISEIHLNGVNYYCFINFSKQQSKRSKGKSQIKGIDNNTTAGCAILVSEKFGELPHTLMFDMCPSLDDQNIQGIDKESCYCIDQEGRLITALFNDFCIITAYAPNYTKKYENEFNIWQTNIISYLQKLKDTISDSTIIFTGDLNITPQHETYNNLINKCGLQEVKGVSNTFYKQNQTKQTKLDYTFVSQNSKLFNHQTAQEIKQFQLVTQLTKFHIPIFSVLENKLVDSDDDDEDDIEELKMMQIILNNKLYYTFPTHQFNEITQSFRNSIQQYINPKYFVFTARELIIFSLIKQFYYLQRIFSFFYLKNIFQFEITPLYNYINVNIFYFDIQSAQKSQLSSQIKQTTQSQSVSGNKNEQDRKEDIDELNEIFNNMSITIDDQQILQSQNLLNYETSTQDKINSSNQQKKYSNKQNQSNGIHQQFKPPTFVDKNNKNHNNQQQKVIIQQEIKSEDQIKTIQEQNKNKLNEN